MTAWTCLWFGHFNKQFSGLIFSFNSQPNHSIQRPRLHFLIHRTSRHSWIHQIRYNLIMKWPWKQWHELNFKQVCRTKNQAPNAYDYTSDIESGQLNPMWIKFNAWFDLAWQGNGFEHLPWWAKNISTWCLWFEHLL